jgi:hypothetical protein
MFAASKTASVSGGYQISRSLRFNSADSAYLNRTPASASNRKTWTWSAWVKKTQILVSGDVPNNLFGARSGNYTLMRFNHNFTAGNTIRIEDSSFSILTLPVYRDASAWYHIVLAVDTTQATDTNRVKLYVNNVLQSFDGSYTSYPAQNYDTQVNNNIAHNIGAQPTYGDYFNGYMTEVNFIDGQALIPSSFGETNAQTGVWQPKAYSGSYGTNGFYLNFSDNSNTTAATLGKDYSGNGNNWTPNNFSVTAGAGNDSLVDSPTSYGTDTGVGGEVRGNYCTLNPLDKESSITLANGNLDVTASGTWVSVRSTFGMTSGKWYWETTFNGFQIMIGIGTSAATLSNYIGADTNGWAYYFGGQKYTNSTGTAYGASYTTGDIIGIAFDADAGSLTFYKNGTSQGVAFTGLTSGPYFPALGLNSATPNINFGQRPFAYTAPSGFKALCTQNLPTPTIGATTATQANKYYDANLYTGNGSTQSITNSGSFKPDFVWIKGRSTSYSNLLFDAVRGTNKSIFSNNTNAEVTDTDALTAFNSNGFTMGAKADINGSGTTYVGWQWKANGSGSTNTSGSITSTVSANTTSGFSVVTYTGTGANATVGHGLGVAPSMIIFKDRSTTTNWVVYHVSVGNTTALSLNLTNATLSPSTAYFNNTTPTSTVFTIGSGTTVNTSSENYVAYAFAPVVGFSAFGSYVGNGSTDGTFVYLGFRPAYIMIKESSAVNGWIVMDSKRSTYNAAVTILQPNTFATESTDATNYAVDFLSNGFKIRNSSTYYNESGGTLIYAAFAESPFKYSLAR